jgi:hypothetical protein
VIRIERRGPEFFARRISGVAIFPCEGGRDEASEQALAAALDNGGAERVTRCTGATIYRTNAGCARRAGVWRTADAPTFHIRRARVEEAAARSDLCFRSKAVWGYDTSLVPAGAGIRDSPADGGPTRHVGQFTGSSWQDWGP